jgi:peptide/nickel transport system permease protein
VRRLGWSLFVVWAVVSITFAINNLLPGDPARLVTGPQARPADVARVRKQLGLDDPPLVQYARFWHRLLHLGPPRDASAGSGRDPPSSSGPLSASVRDPAHPTCAVIVPLGARSVHVDFGKSFQKRQAVVDLVATRLPRTFALALAGVLLQLLFGIGSGTLAAVRPGTRLDRLLVGTSLLGISAPTFLVALLLQWTFARGLGWLPPDGFGSTLGEHARSLVLPALTLGVYGAAYYTRLVRDEMVVLLGQDWVRTARAKGAGGRRIVMVHALRNALVPVVTAAGLDFGALMGGAVVTETVFRWPGLGELSVRALLDRDGPIILACVVVTSLAVVLANLVVDVAYARLDPRVER